jgi:hypothetical protein
MADTTPGRPNVSLGRRGPLTTSAFDLPDHLSPKADPALIAGDERHCAAIADGLEQSIADLSPTRRSDGRWCPEQVDAAGGDPHHEEHMDPLQEHGVNREEVTGERLDQQIVSDISRYSGQLRVDSRYPATTTSPSEVDPPHRPTPKRGMSC